MVISKLPTAFYFGSVYIIKFYLEVKAPFKVGRGIFFCLQKISYLEHFDHVK